MSSEDSCAILNDAFVRIYRSLGHYLNSAAPVFNVGEDVLPRVIDEQIEDANELGAIIQERRGFVDQGSYPHEYSDTHFLNTSRLLDLWVVSQTQVVTGLENDLARLSKSDETYGVLKAIVERANQHLATLQQLKSSTPANV